jgi:uncharacterized protein YciI
MLATALIALLVLASGQTAQSVAPESATPVPPRFFAVEFRTGPKWDASKPPNEQAHFQDHSSNLQRLRKEGRILLGGRYTDRGLLILSGASEDDVRGLFTADPSVANGVFVFDVWEFRPFFPGCVGAKPS